jgi:7,8-dihydroneopterin aldolase/epimerase/oxygenase
MSAIVEVHGLELHGFHGVLDEEAEHGQTFVFDLRLEVAEPERDDVQAAVDYREVVELVQEISDGVRFQLLESLAAAVADGIRARFPVERVRVRVRKPQVELVAPVEFTAATVERP